MKLENFKSLHALGFSLLWLRSKSKAPYERDWTNAPRKTWHDLEQTFNPDNNVGVRLGEKSKLSDGTYLAVVDCDVKSSNPKHLDEMMQKLTEVTTLIGPTVASGRGNGSAHIYVRTKTPVKPFRFARSTEVVKVHMPTARPSKTELAQLSPSELDRGTRLRPAWEISVMSTGQQVVLPPSIHPDTGNEYTWERPLGALESIPLVELTAPIAGAGVGKFDPLQDFTPVEVELFSTNLSERISDMIVSGKGVEDRSAALMSACLAMLGIGLTDEQIMTVLTDEEYFLGCVPYEHTKSRSRLKAAQWVLNYCLRKARHKMSAENDFANEAMIEEEPLTPAQAEEQERELVGQEAHWRTLLDRNRTDGKIKPNFRNTLLILRYAPFEGGTLGAIFGRDVFNQVDMIVSASTPWGSVGPKQLTDHDGLLIKRWLVFHFSMEPSIGVIHEVMTTLALNNTFHPVRDYLDALKWDGESRIETWLVDYCQARGPSKYLAQVGRKMLVAMIKRIYFPGAKFDFVPILEGTQGIGKSRGLAALAGEWFSDSPLRLDDKDGVLNIQGHWLIELGELSVMTRGDVNHLKEFISHQQDKVRAPYERRAQILPRQCVFVGTTNNDEYLKDTTGNRRFWPVRVGKVDVNAIQRDRDQLFAEAKWVLENFGEDLYLDDAEAAAAALVEQAERIEVDDWEEDIREVLSDPDFPETFSIKQLAGHPKATLLSLRSRGDQLRIGGVLRKLGIKKIHTRYGKRWKGRVLAETDPS